jgi:flagellar biosynthesis anti-sigma factor FlgM
MRISDLNIPGSTSVSPKKTTGVGGKKSDSSAVSKGAQKGDQVDISGTGGMMKALRASYDQAPDVRMEKVDALKERIDKGEYHPQADEIASAILRHVRQMTVV